MRVVVTGGTGFIGGHIAAGLAADGHDVVAVGRRADPQLASGVTYERWDITLPTLPERLRGADAVVHAAAEVADWGPWRRFRSTTVDGTVRILEALPQARIILIGSASVYDPYRPQVGVKEEDGPAVRFRNAYGLAKAVQERVTLAMRPDALVLRPHAVYGPGDRTLMPRLLAARRFGRLPLPGGGREPISITHVDHVVDAVRAGLSRVSVHGPCNVADRDPVAPRDFLSALFVRMAMPTRIVDVPIGVAWPVAHALELGARLAGRQEAPRLTTYALSHLAWPFVLDVTRAERELGLDLSPTFDTHLEELARDARQVLARRATPGHPPRHRDVAPS